MKALVLEGGGAKGAYQIGAYKALYENGERFDIITGTSIGALNGAMIVQDHIEEAYDLWYNLSPDQVVAGDADLLEKLIHFNVTSEDIHPMLKYFKQIIGKMGIDVTPLRAMIEAHVDEEVVRSAETKFGFVTVSLTDMKPVEKTIDEIPEGELNDYLMASANLPVFKVSHKNGKMYIDGGFYDNLPLSLAKRMGATEFTCIELGAIGVKRIPKDIVRRQIAPREDLGRLLEFTTERARYNLKLGYMDALRMLKNLKGKRYYIVDDVGEDALLNRIVISHQASLEHIKEILGLQTMNNRRFLFEKLIPQMTKQMSLDVSASYGDIIIALLEEISAMLGLERFVVRKLSDWVKDLQEHYVPGDVLTPDIKGLQKFFVQTNLLDKHHKELLMRTIYEKLIYEVTT